MNYVVKVPIAGHVFVTVKDAKAEMKPKKKRCIDVVILTMRTCY